MSTYMLAQNFQNDNNFLGEIRAYLDNILSKSYKTARESQKLHFGEVICGQHYCQVIALYQFGAL